MFVYIGYLLLVWIQIPIFCRNGILSKTSFNTKKFLILCCIELVFLAGIRGYTIGADTEVYLGAIDYYGELSKQELIKSNLIYPFDFEIGYFIFMKIWILLGVGKTGFLFVVAVITYVPIFVIIKKYSAIPSMSILAYFALGFFVYSLGLFRQMIAISILFLGWEYIIKRQLFKYILVVLLAMSFHTTAIVATVLYFLYGIEWERIAKWILPIEVVLLIFGRKLVLIFFSIFSKYSHYIGGIYDVQGGSYTMLILLNVILYMRVLVKRKQENENEELITCALMLAVCAQCLGYSMGIFGRVVSYFSIYLILAIPNLVSNVERKVGVEGKIVMAIIAYLSLGILTYMEFNENGYVVPYYSIFNMG